MEDSEYIRIGAGCTFTDILESKLTPAILKEAALQVAAPAIRNFATVGGNICNGSPKGDSTLIFYVTDSILRLVSSSGERLVPISEFFLGRNKTSLQKDELLVEIKYCPARTRRIISGTYYRQTPKRPDGKLIRVRINRNNKWFLAQVKDLVDEELAIEKKTLGDFSREELYQLKRKGFSDRRLAKLLKTTEQAVRERRKALNVRPVYKRVDTCAAEFATRTAYMYSTYEDECEAEPTNRKKIIVLGGGPNRIGQGIEFDYCCVHAAMALREDGYETIMVNCNPETVSTDYDTSDRLYFEPVTLEDVLEIVHKEKPLGVIVQYGGQTPLKLARDLERCGVPIIGTTPDMIDARDRNGP
jgi:hypothetical protein